MSVARTIVDPAFTKIEPNQTIVGVVVLVSLKLAKEQNTAAARTRLGIQTTTRSNYNFSWNYCRRNSRIR